ncbi:MAG: recombination regulator RecX [Burkholderiales bacterium]|nr:recombination regulator RecX [Burkholderiales bacterium]
MAAPSLRDKALALLARREHSRAELRRKLGTDENRDELDAVLDDLIARGWQSDLRFATAYISAYAQRFGRYRLEAELRERGVADADISLAFESQDDDTGTELERAREVWQKKFSAPATDAAERAKQARFLQSRGFAYDIIRKVLGGLDD